MQDVVIIGGSFAGLSAALQLGRARRKVIVLDTMTPRNRFAAHAHGVLGHDGKPPHRILGEAIAQMRPYGTVRFIQARAETVSGGKDDFRVTTADGETIATRRVFLSHGVTDIMPDIEGFAECWGQSVLHCPYCHGFEVADRRLGVLYFSPLSQHVAAMLGDWTGDLAVFADGHEIAPDFRETLRRKGIGLIEPKVVRLMHQDGRLAAVGLADGSEVGLDALFAGPRQRPSADFHRQLGLAMDEGPLGAVIRVDDSYETSVPGIYAAGDVASMKQSVPLAMAHGNVAGVFCHHSLLD
jgi:Thioredoxin reductase